MASDAVVLTVPGPARRPRGAHLESRPRALAGAGHHQARPGELPRRRSATRSSRANGDRPVSLQRFPEGIDGEQFFSKNPPKGAPDYVRSVTVVYPSARSHPQLVHRRAGRRGLGGADEHDRVPPVAVAGRGLRQPRPAAHRPRPAAGHRTSPTRSPPPSSCGRCWRRPGSTAFVKTSGNRGLHVFAPIEPDARVPRRAARRHRGRPRARAADARPGHDRVVEGGARRAHLRRLQPGEPRPHDGRRLQPAGAARTPRSRPRSPGTSSSTLDPSTFTVADRAGAAADRRRPVGRRSARSPARIDDAARVVGARPRRTGSASCRSRPTTRRCRASRRACSRAGRRRPS